VANESKAYLNELKIYRLWIDFLKEAPPESWSEEVRIDFAGCDTHPTDSKEFERWLWEADYHHGLFFDANKAIPTVIHPSAVDKPLDDKQITLVINIADPDDHITEGVLAYVNLFREEMDLKKLKPGRREFKPDPAKYPLAMRPDIDALEIALDAHRLIKEHAGDENWPLWKIGEELAKRYPIATKVKLKSAGPDREKELGDLAFRYEERALRVIEGVKVGTFPAK
jgi:hypothetical protein